MKKIPMTFQGFEKLRKELHILKTVKRSHIISSIALAREYGDLKENAEYNVAREEQGFCEGRIREIEEKLSKAEIIDVTKILNTGRVIFGATITVFSISLNEEVIYRIVGDDEADLRKNLISVNSPMARGLVGKKVNHVAIINTPSGDVKYKILKIEHL